MNGMYIKTTLAILRFGLPMKMMMIHFIELKVILMTRFHCMYYCHCMLQSQVKTLNLWNIMLPGSASASQDLATCLSHMPHLTDLTLYEVTLHEAFYSTMKSMASGTQVGIKGVEELTLLPSKLSLKSNYIVFKRKMKLSLKQPY